MEPKPARLCAGIDEAGRGALAGPVVAAAVILPDSGAIPGLDDSKKLSPKKREALALAIRSVAKCWAIGAIWPARIDEINILQATFEAMADAARRLAQRPDKLLIDGNFVIPQAILARKAGAGAPLPEQAAIIKGDALIPAISAASIIAKVFRDRLMIRLARRWPVYGFEAHKGYGARRHIEAIKANGPCPMHRLTFRQAGGIPPLLACR